MANWNDIEARRQAREEREQNAVQSLFNAIALQPTPEQEQHALSFLGLAALHFRRARQITRNKSRIYESG